jgi:hypothetical protein
MDKVLENLKHWVGPEFQFQLQLVDDVERTAVGKCREVTVDIKDGSS